MEPRFAGYLCTAAAIIVGGIADAWSSVAVLATAVVLAVVGLILVVIDKRDDK
jgi:Flp pilus assembly protein TadB